MLSGCMTAAVLTNDQVLESLVSIVCWAGGERWREAASQETLGKRKGLYRPYRRFELRLPCYLPRSGSIANMLTSQLRLQLKTVRCSMSICFHIREY